MPGADADATIKARIVRVRAAAVNIDNLSSISLLLCDDALVGDGIVGGDGVVCVVGVTLQLLCMLT